MSGGGAVPDDAVRLEPRRQTPLYRWLSAQLLRFEARSRARGSRAARWGMRAIWTAVALVGLLLLVGPVVNAPLELDDYYSSAEDAGESWIARSFAADYEVQRTGDGRLELEVEERVQAFFPDGVDLDGIERTLVTELHGHDLRPELVEATLDGSPADVTVADSATRTTFAIAAGERLGGDHDVLLRYTLHDVAADVYDESTGRWQQTLDWDALGAEWAQGTLDKRISVTLPRDLDDALLRQPRASLAWLLLSTDVALEPDSETVDAVTYSATNDQTMPPYASFRLALNFAPGTFAMPPHTPLYWVMVVGPFLPLLVSGAVLLLALAARAVAWADARGRLWYVAQYGPQPDVSPALASHLWGGWRVAALVRAIAAYQRDRSARPKLLRELHRAGRVGDVAAARLRFRAAPERREQRQRGLRRSTAGVVRDGFLGAAVALPVLQIGLARQLSHQMPLSVYWWPLAIVAATAILSVVVIAIATSAFPLTRRGAFAREHLLGLRQYIEQARTAEQTTLRDPLLPYVVLFAGARDGRRIVERALDDAGVPRTAASDPTLLTGGRLAIRAVAILAPLVAILLANTVASPTVETADDSIFDADLAGDYGAFVRAFDATGELIPTADGGLAVEVEERLEMVVEDRHEVPQLLREWRDRPDGSRQELEVTTVEVDGAEVPFETGRRHGKAYLRTELADDWPGEHDVVVRYRLADAAAAIRTADGWRDAVTWTALTPDWDWNWSGVDVDVERVSFALRVPQDIAADAEAVEPLDAPSWTSEDDPPLLEATEDDDAVVYRTALAADDDQWFWLSQGMAGVQLRFDEGAFSSDGRGPWIRHALWQATPPILTVGTGVVALAAALIGVFGGRRLRPGLGRDAARWLAPALAVTQLVLFVWMTADASGEEWFFIWPGVLLLANLAAAVWSLVATRKR
ncbi:hypothetical protein GCM10022219_27870 [Microbacterium oryzae]|uniref:DUF2207 domain-containing protein n=1 Tax=Microbacterium oryzae TaxID=743009 RepID=A0A6I6DT68_9MICO|nr:DUF2207 domain-containing protein [Microbacterium oryzae]QGU27266.1 hypothetical protein D7D94_06000 [Microbacterium oryzae]